MQLPYRRGYHYAGCRVSDAKRFGDVSKKSADECAGKMLVGGSDFAKTPQLTEFLSKRRHHTHDHSLMTQAKR